MKKSILLLSVVALFATSSLFAQENKSFEIAASFGYGGFSDSEVSEIYKGFVPISVRGVYFVNPRFSVGPYVEIASAKGDPIQYGLNDPSVTSSFKYSAFGAEANLYLREQFYLLGKIGSLNFTEELSAYNQNVSESLKLTQFSLGAGIVFPLGESVSTVWEVRNNWLSSGEYELDGRINNWAFSAGLSVKF